MRCISVSHTARKREARHREGTNLPVKSMLLCIYQANELIRNDPGTIWNSMEHQTNCFMLQPDSNPSFCSLSDSTHAAVLLHSLEAHHGGHRIAPPSSCQVVQILLSCVGPWPTQKPPRIRAVARCFLLGGILGVYFWAVGSHHSC